LLATSGEAACRREKAEAKGTTAQGTKTKSEETKKGDFKQ